MTEYKFSSSECDKCDLTHNAIFNGEPEHTDMLVARLKEISELARRMIDMGIDWRIIRDILHKST